LNSQIPPIFEVIIYIHAKLKGYRLDSPLGYGHLHK
jgi:hypothetical protein